MYVVLLGMVLVVLSFLAPKQQTAARAGSPQMGPEIEEAMDQFIAEIEADNKELLNTVAQMKKDHDRSMSKLAERVEELEKRVREQDQELKRMAFARLAEREAEPKAPRLQEAFASATKPQSAEHEGNAASVAVQEPPAAAKGLVNIRERYGELFRLHDEGKSIETIAKKIGMNKGEVTLILQLAKQEER